MKERRLHIVLLVALMLVSIGCSREDDIIPSYIHLDKISVTHNSDGSTSLWNDGWLTHDIDAAQVEIWFEGDMSTTKLGTFELPFTVPILTNNREIKKIQVSAFVKQNGIAATHIPYPFYKFYIGENYKIAPDSITNLGVQNSDGEWEISVPYYSADNMIKVSEFFEPLQLSTVLDSNVIRVYDEDARSGSGFGRVNFKSDEEHKTFFIKDKITEYRKESNIYLEMDYRTDAMLTVSMESSFVVNGAPSIAGVMTLYATDNEWHKIYINLGRTWRYFNYNPNFRIGFSILNTDGIDGKVDIDNLKVLSRL